MDLCIFEGLLYSVAILLKESAKVPHFVEAIFLKISAPKNKGLGALICN